MFLQWDCDDDDDDDDGDDDGDGGDDDICIMMTMMMMMMARVLSWPVHVFKAKYDLGRIELHLVLVENPMLRQVVVKVTWLMIIEDNWS